MRCRRISTDALIAQATRDLPLGWQIRICIEYGEIWVELRTAEDDIVTDVAVDGETSLPEAIADAINEAKD
jgi:hypothetical protein